MNNLTAQCNPGCSGMRHPADSVKMAHRTAANRGPSSSLAFGEAFARRALVRDGREAPSWDAESGPSSATEFLTYAPRDGRDDR